jgi:hypothetical protein
MNLPSSATEPLRQGVFVIATDQMLALAPREFKWRANV